MTLEELASFMIKLGCEEAMNLDGGGSATLWYDGDVRISPSSGGARDSQLPGHREEESRSWDPGCLHSALSYVYQNLLGGLLVARHMAGASGRVEQ
jgi:hypothetical protein